MDFRTAVKLENSLSSNEGGEVRSNPEVNGCRELAIVKEEPCDEPSFMDERARVDPLQQSWNECFPTNSSNPCEPSQSVQRNPVESDLTVFRRPRNGIPGVIVDSPDWLPPGWITEMKTRESGLSAGTTDKYYIEPCTRHRFRSKAEVIRFLETGVITRPRPRPRAKLLESISIMSVPPLNLIKPCNVTSNSSEEKEPELAEEHHSSAATASNSHPQPADNCSFSKRIGYYQPVLCYSPVYAQHPGLYPVVYFPVIANQEDLDRECCNFPPLEFLQNMQLQPIFPWPGSVPPPPSWQQVPRRNDYGSITNQFSTNFRHTNSPDARSSQTPCPATSYGLEFAVLGVSHRFKPYCLVACLLEKKGMQNRVRSGYIHDGNERSEFLFCLHLLDGIKTNTEAGCSNRGSSSQNFHQKRNQPDSPEYVGIKKNRLRNGLAGFDGDQFSSGKCLAEDRPVNNLCKPNPPCPSLSASRRECGFKPQEFGPFHQSSRNQGSSTSQEKLHSGTSSWSMRSKLFNSSANSGSLRSFDCAEDGCSPCSVLQDTNPPFALQKRPFKPNSELLKQQTQIPRMRGHLASARGNLFSESLALTPPWSNGSITYNI
eukprot:Gb_03340 [translate_table: standard]